LAALATTVPAGWSFCNGVAQMMEPKAFTVLTSCSGVPGPMSIMSPILKPESEATGIFVAPFATAFSKVVEAGATFLLGFFFGFLPLPPIMAPMPPAWQQQHKQMRRIHSQIGNCEPQEPEAVDPELADPEESLAQDP